MKMNSILASILWFGLCIYSVSSYADGNSDYPEDDNRTPIAPPEIISQPATYTVSRNESVTLHCEVKNKDTEAALLWHHSNKTNNPTESLLVFADAQCFVGPLCDYYQLDSNAATLLIRRVNDETAGTYVCSYRQLSIIYKVHMKAAVESIVGQKSVEAGDELRLECRVAGYPTPEVMWHRQVNETSPKIALGSGGNLTISHVTTAHTGIYTCTAYNFDRQQPPATRSIHISVVKGIAAVNPIVNAGENPANINLCCIYGQTKKEPQIKWLKNGKDILGTNSRYQINKAHKTRSCLTILTAKEEDLGTYTCQFVKEPVDPKSPVFAQIEVTGIPVTPELLQVTADASKTPVLKWKVKSFSPLTSYQVRVKKPEQTENDWLLQVNKTVSSNDKEEIIEQSLDSVQNGMYDVELIVENKYGTARLVSNNKVVVDRSGIEVIAEKINSDNNGNGASRSIGMSVFCVILGIVLWRL